MNKFNLTFSGEILAGENLEQVKLRFADKFGIDDCVRLERFFSGDPIILRRNLERKDAAELFHQLQLLGAVAALVKVTTSELADDVINTPPNAPAKTGALEPLSPAPWPPNSADAAAEIKAHKLESQRLTAEKAAQEKVAAEAQQREMAEEEARKKDRAAANLRLAEEEHARQAAEKARLAAEETALRDAKKAEVKRLEEEEAARKKALKVVAKRKAAEEAAQRKARRTQEKAEKAQRKAEEAARRKVELEEKKRLEAEEEARRKAELEEKKRLEVEEEARRKAELEEKKRLEVEEEARRKAELEEKKRLEVEEEARRKAELEEKKRLEVEEEARRKAELEERNRLAAKEEARRKAALEKKKRQAAQKKARRQAALDKKKRLATAQTTHIKDAQQRLKEKDPRKSDKEQPKKIVARSESSQRDAKPLQTAERGTQRSRKPVKGRVKTTLDVPLRKRGQTPEVGTPGRRKRQSGEPNLYKIRPFRNSQEVRTRATHARERMCQAYTVGLLALATLIIAGGSFLQSAVYPVITGASAVAINLNSEPLLLAGDSLLFHDRAGVSKAEVALSKLGINTLQAPLAFDSEDALIALGMLEDNSANPETGDALQLLRCSLELPVCEQFSPQLQDSRIDAFVINPLDSSLLLADSAAGKLLKINSQGTVVTSAFVAIPEEPVLRLHGGLLLMNSAEGPAISVLRYEDNAFAKQLDEILLLPPTGEQLEASRVGDFIWSGSAWWVDLRDPASGSGELHRFDEDWNYLDTVTLAPDTGPLQLIRWGRKTLVNDPRHPAIQRYNIQGVVEEPFMSTLLQGLISGQQQHTRLTSLAWQGGLLVCTLAALLSFGFGYLQGLRALVYRPRREQGAEPLDENATTLRWIEPVQNRQLQLRRTGIFYGLGVLGALLLAIALSVSVWQLAALLLALCGPAIALLLLSRQAAGHIGFLGDKLLLVDHSGMYHLAGGPRLHYRGPFLSIDDIVVFCGSRLLPAFSPAPLQQHISPPTLGGIKVDHKTIAVKLLECRHPLALGVVAIVATTAAAALLLLLQSIF